MTLAQQEKPPGRAPRVRPAQPPPPARRGSRTGPFGPAARAARSVLEARRGGWPFPLTILKEARRAACTLGTRRGLEARRRTVDALIDNRWLVFTERDLCARLRHPRENGEDLRRIACERGPRFDLWGRSTPGRRMGCPGRVTFWVRPHGVSGDVAMT